MLVKDELQAPVIVPMPMPPASDLPVDLNREDGTTALLRAGFSTIGVGLLAAVLTLFIFGGIGPQGPYSNPGWLCLIVCLMSTPFGVLLSALGIAKWFRNRGIQRRAQRA